MATRSPDRSGRSLLGEILTGTLALFAPIALVVAFVPFDVLFDSPQLAVTTERPTSAPILVLPDEPVASSTPEAEVAGSQVTPAPVTPAPVTPVPVTPLPVTPGASATPTATATPEPTSTPTAVEVEIVFFPTPEPTATPLPLEIEVTLPPGAQTAFDVLAESDG